MFYLNQSKLRKLYCAILAGLSFCMFNPLGAQSPSDGIMMPGKQICLAGIYSHDSWKEYWEGTLLRSNGNIGTFTRNSYAFMAAGGFTDRINLIVSLPYIKTSPSGGQFKGVQGIQDFGMWAKGLLLDKKLGGGNFTTIGVLGFTVPVTNYLSDYAPFSLGFRCPELQSRLILQYKANIGLYARVTGAFFLRGNSTIERDYYYTSTGNYTNKVDMPNANHFSGTLGWWLFNDKLKVETSYERFNTLGGFDIRRQDAGFPSNKMESSSVQGHIQYFSPIKGLGVIATYGKVLEGRNLGKTTSIVAGITYQFGI